MKKVLYTLAAFSFVFVACNKQEIVLEEGSSQEGELTTVTIKASNGDADTKATINNDREFSWTAGDQIAVHTDAGRFYTSEALTTGGTTADFTVSLSGNRNGYAVYPASVAKSYSESTLTLTLPSEYTFAQVSGENTPLPMIADNTSAALSFCHVAGLLRLTISNIPTETNKIKLDFNGKKVSGDFTISSPIAGTSTIAAVSGTKGTDDIIWITDITGTAATVNIPLPTGATYSDLVVSAWNDDAALRGQVVAFNTYTPARAHGKKLSAALNLGAVSIASGKYAVFAPGNLQAVFTEAGTSCAWKFADHQYDIIGDAAANNAVTHGGVSAAGTVDLFGFVGSNSEFDGLAQYGISNSTTMADYRTAGYILKSDWGNLEISGYAANTWRTPAGGDPGSEWSYLFQTRTDATSKYGHATVGGKNGLVVLPDSFIDPMKNNGSAAFVSGKVNYTDNVYTSGGNWEAMEAAGAFFLPSGGYRNGTTVGRFNEYGCYLTTGCSTIINFCMRINDKGLQANIEDDYFSGQSVRLVRDLN